jgi:catechol 2,3-dioxygenase-like lactoylglutathione lyase family enzyme
MNVLGSAAVVRSTDRDAAVRRYEALFGVPPLNEFPIVDWKLNVAVFPGLSVLSGEPSALARLADLRAMVFVGSLRETEVELRQTGWATEGPLGPGASLLARDPDGNLIEFVENPGGVQ